MRAIGLWVTIAAVVMLASPAVATDTWTDLMPGVRHLHRVTSVPWDIHVVTVDLTNPHVRVRVAVKNDNDYPDSGEIVRSMCQRYNAVAGINCDFFAFGPDPDPLVGDHSHIPQGYCFTDGLQLLPPGHASPIVASRTAIQFPRIPGPNPFGMVGTIATPAAWAYNIAAGGPRILANGLIWGQAGYAWNTEGLSGLDTRQPRTGAAISQDWHTLILATVDGRQTSSAGMSSAELASLLKEFGGYNGLGFDSGGSTTMVINGTTVNSPSDGSDRCIANALMILDDLAQPPGPTVHYETGFESPTYGQGSIAGKDGWAGSGQVVAGGHAGAQCARLSGSTAYRVFSAAGLRGVRWIECWVRTSSTTATSYLYATSPNASDTAALIRFSSNGKIDALEGDGVGGGTWTALSDYAANTWYRIHLRLDYNINNYQAFVNGALKISGAWFRNSGASAGLGAIRFEAGAGSDLYVDDLYAGSVDPDYIRVSPDACGVLAGGSRTFTAVSGAAPVSWSVVDERDQGGASVPAGTIAQIDSLGILTAIAPGSCIVRAAEPSGRADRSSVITVLPAISLADAKGLGDGQSVGIAGLVVSAVYTDCIYAQTLSRELGIRIVTAQTVSEGDRISVLGTVDTISGERVLYADDVQVLP